MGNHDTLLHTKTRTDLWKERIKILFSFILPNRTFKYFPPEFIMKDPMTSLIHQQLKNDEQQCAIILFCLDNFQFIVTSYPPALIEKMQQCIRNVMKKFLPLVLKEHEIIGVKQFHDDDYCLFIRLDHSTTYDQLQAKVHTIRKKIEQQVNESLKIFMEGSLYFQTGIYVFPKGEQMKDTKIAIKNGYRYAHAVALNQLPTHFSCSREELRKIIETENISVLAQPILNLKNGEIFGWELLTRGPQNTLFHLPTELFNFAYQADLLTNMEFLVIKKALKKISESNIKESVFINITSVSLCHPLFLNRILEKIRSYDNIKPEQIIFEITERHSIRDYEHMALIMAKFRSHGFRFAVDDVGAGYASLQSISELIPDIIKIDKSVIQKIDQVSVKQSLLKTLLFFAENVNCRVIAEGVETEAEAEVLFQYQVEMGQGYYFARPEPLHQEDERSHFDLMKQKIKLRQQNITA